MLSSTLYTLALGALATSVSAQHGAEEDGKMGPVGFLWPEDRAWNANHDNTAPCGSVAGVTVRTEFPLCMAVPPPNSPIREQPTNSLLQPVALSP